VRRCEEGERAQQTWSRSSQLKGYGAAVRVAEEAWTVQIKSFDEVAGKFGYRHES